MDINYKLLICNYCL